MVRKGEIACHKQFLPFLTMFSTLYVLRTNSVTKKEMNKCMAEMILAGFEPGPPG